MRVAELGWTGYAPAILAKETAEMRWGTGREGEGSKLAIYRYSLVLIIVLWPIKVALP